MLFALCSLSFFATKFLFCSCCSSQFSSSNLFALLVLYQEKMSRSAFVSAPLHLMEFPVEILGKIFSSISDIADIKRIEKVSHQFQVLALEFSWPNITSLRVGSLMHSPQRPHNGPDMMWTVNDNLAGESALPAVKHVWQNAKQLNSVEFRITNRPILVLPFVEMKDHPIKKLTFHFHTDFPATLGQEEEARHSAAHFIMVRSLVSSLGEMPWLEELDLTLSILQEKDEAMDAVLYPDVLDIFRKLESLKSLDIGGNFSDLFPIVGMMKGLSFHKESLKRLSLRTGESQNLATAFSDIFDINGEQTQFPHLEALEMDIERSWLMKFDPTEFSLFSIFPSLKDLSLCGSMESVFTTSPDTPFVPLICNSTKAFLSLHKDSNTPRGEFLKISVHLVKSAEPSDPAQLNFGAALAWRIPFWLSRNLERPREISVNCEPVQEFLLYGAVDGALAVKQGKAYVLMEVFEDF